MVKIGGKWKKPVMEILIVEKIQKKGTENEKYLLRKSWDSVAQNTSQTSSY